MARSVDDVGVAGEPTSGVVDVRRQMPQPASAAPDPAAASIDATAPGSMGVPPALLDAAPREATMRRWNDIQSGFVDEPQQAVQDADLLQRLAQMFSAGRQQLEAQGSRGPGVHRRPARQPSAVPLDLPAPAVGVSRPDAKAGPRTTTRSASHRSRRRRGPPLQRRIGRCTATLPGVGAYGRPRHRTSCSRSSR